MWTELLPYVGPGGAVTLLLAVAAMVYTDRLVPYRSHKRQLDAITKDRDDWKAAYRIEHQLNEIQAKQLEKLIGQGDTMVALLSALPRAKEPL